MYEALSTGDVNIYLMKKVGPGASLGPPVWSRVETLLCLPLTVWLWKLSHQVSQSVFKLHLPWCVTLVKEVLDRLALCLKDIPSVFSMLVWQYRLSIVSCRDQSPPRTSAQRALSPCQTSAETEKAPHARQEHRTALTLSVLETKVHLFILHPRACPPPHKAQHHQATGYLEARGLPLLVRLLWVLCQSELDKTRTAQM